jgi:hypothetical protein
MRTLFFIVNFSGAILVTMMCIVSIGVAESPYSFLGGIMLFPFAVAFAIAEWAAWYRRRPEVEKLLGVFYLCLCGFSAFAVAGNVAKALQASWSGDSDWLVVIGFVIASYFGICGGWRVWCRREVHKSDAADG